MTPEEIRAKFETLGDKEQLLVMIGNYLSQAWKMGKVNVPNDRFVDWQMSTIKIIAGCVTVQALSSLTEAHKRTGKPLDKLILTNVDFIAYHMNAILDKNELLCEVIFKDFGGANANRGDKS